MVVMKIVTAAVSYATAIAVYRIIPLAMLIPSPIQLELEINERKAAQGKLQSRYERSVVTNQVTREIRRNLQLGAICRATAEHCAELFNADECTLYQHKRKSPKPAPAPEEQPTDERDSQCQGADCAAQPCREEAASTTPQEVKDHRYSVLSEHTTLHGRTQKGDGALGPTGEEMEPVGTRQRRHSALKRNLQRRAPPLHLLPGYGPTSAGYTRHIPNVVGRCLCAHQFPVPAQGGGDRRGAGSGAHAPGRRHRDGRGGRGAAELLPRARRGVGDVHRAALPCHLVRCDRAAGQEQAGGHSQHRPMPLVEPRRHRAAGGDQRPR